MSAVESKSDSSSSSSSLSQPGSIIDDEEGTLALTPPIQNSPVAATTMSPMTIKNTVITPDHPPPSFVHQQGSEENDIKLSIEESKEPSPSKMILVSPEAPVVRPVKRRASTEDKPACKCKLLKPASDPDVPKQSEHDPPTLPKTLENEDTPEMNTPEKSENDVSKQESSPNIKMVAHVSRTAPQEPQELAPPPTSQEPDTPQESQLGFEDTSESAGKKRPASDSMENDSKHTRLQLEEEKENDQREPVAGKTKSSQLIS